MKHICFSHNMSHYTVGQLSLSLSLSLSRHNSPLPLHPAPRCHEMLLPSNSICNRVYIRSPWQQGRSREPQYECLIWKFYLLSKARKFAKSARWLGRTELRIGPFLLVTDTIQIQYSLYKGGRDSDVIVM